MSTWGVVLRAMWGTWAFFVAIWFSVSAIVYVSQGDAGSFIGGGIVVAIWTAIVIGATYFIRTIDAGGHR